MAISVTLKQNKFGRPYKAFPHHYIGLAATLTGGSGQYQMRFSPDWDNWFDIQTSNSILSNKDGYIIALAFWHGTYNLEFRDKANITDTVAVNAYELFYANQDTGIPMGDTPYIVNIDTAISTSITIKTVKPNSIVRVYRSRADKNNNQTFFPTDEPFREGISNSAGEITLSLPITNSGIRVCATAFSENEFESLSTNYIEINGTKKKQIQATIAYGAATGTGRKITVTAITGGSGSYSIGTLNNNLFPYILNQEFEIPFGKSNIFIRDNNAEPNVEWHISLSVDGGSSTQTFYNHDIRNNFNIGSNTGAIRYGKLVGTTFTAANEYASHDGRISWGFSGTNFPAIGIYENSTFTLPPDRLLFHPNVVESGCIRYTATASGTLSISGNSMRVGVIVHPYLTLGYNLTSKFKILHNGVIKYSYTHVSQNGNQDFNLNFQVANNDIIDLVVECGDESDFNYDHVHVKAALSLATAGTTTTAPTAPVLSNSTPILTGNNILGTGVQSGDFVVMYKNGYPESLAITSGSNFTHGAMYDGTWTAKIARNKVLSAASNAIITNQTGNTAPPAPIILSSDMNIGGTISGTTTQAGAILIFKDGIQIPQSSTTTPNGLSFTWSFTPSEIGNYTFKLTNANGTSSDSNSVSISRRRKFTITGVTWSSSVCEVPISDLESGSGDNISAVDNWTSGLTFEHTGTVSSISKGFARIKAKPTVVSSGVLLLK